MSTAIVILIGCLIVLMDATIVWLIFRALATSWNDLADRHPATPPAPDAVRRDFQSFKLGLFSLGWSVHVAADAERLHLLPAALLRFAGARPASIPWEAVRLTTPRKRKGFLAAKIGGVELVGPAWALSLANNE